MLNFLFAATLYCPKYLLINKTNLWTAKDQKVLIYVKTIGCKKQYSDSPCLIIFDKAEEGVYSVICGEKRKK